MQFSLQVRVLKEQLRRSQEMSLTHEEKVTNLHTEVRRLKNRGKKLELVAKQKNLLERESLTLQLQEAKEQLQDRDGKLKVNHYMLARLWYLTLNNYR